MDLFSFTDNAGLCGIPGLRTCGPHLSAGAMVGIALGSCVSLLLIITCITCLWKRRQNILRAQKIAGKDNQANLWCNFLADKHEKAMNAVNQCIMHNMHWQVTNKRC